MAKVFSHTACQSGSAKTLAAAAVTETCFSSYSSWLATASVLSKWITDTSSLQVCKYARSVRRLPKASHITLILKDFSLIFLFFPGVKASPFVDLKFRKVCEDTVKDRKVAETGCIRVDGFHELLCVFYLCVPLTKDTICLLSLLVHCFFFYFWTFEKRRVHFQTLRFHENSLHDQGRGLQPDQGAKAMSCDVKLQLLRLLDLFPRQKSNVTQLFTRFKWKRWNAFRFLFFGLATSQAERLHWQSGGLLRHSEGWKWMRNMPYFL